EYGEGIGEPGGAPGTGGGVASKALFVKFPELLVKANKRPSGLKTISPAAPLDSLASTVPLTSEVVSFVRSRRKTLCPIKGIGSEFEGVGIPGGVVGSMRLLVRSVALLVKASEWPSGLKTGSAAVPLDSNPSGVTLTSVVLPVVSSRTKMFDVG